MRLIPILSEKYLISEDGTIILNAKGHKMSCFKNEVGYLRVALSVGERQQRIFYVHRLVASAYLKIDLKRPLVNHKDGNKSNNHFSNLEWCTHSENHQHAFKNGIRAAVTGEASHASKLTEKDVLKIRKLFEKGTPIHLLCKKTGMSRGAIAAIVSRKTWKYI